jgi:hypothetical protein
MPELGWPKRRRVPSGPGQKYISNTAEGRGANLGIFQPGIQILARLLHRGVTSLVNLPPINNRAAMYQAREISRVIYERGDNFNKEISIKYRQVSVR